MALAAMRRWPRARIDGGRAVIPTHCLYPSNACVNVVVEGGEATFTVNDDGGAFDDVQTAGVELDPSRVDRLLWPLVKKQGLGVSGGIIHAQTVPSEALQAAIVLVANASKEAAHFLLDHTPVRMRKNFRADLAHLLETTFPGRLRKGYRVAGASDKQHTFDFAVELPNDKRLLIDAVSNDANSINAVIVSNLDVRNARHKNIQQRIVYDDTAEWATSDLRLLQVAGTLVPLGKARGVIERLVA